VTRHTPRELAAIGVGVLAVAGVAVLLVGYAPGWWSGSGSYAPSRVLASTSVEPGHAQFGDVVTLRARVIVDRRTVDPGSVGLDARFTPFRVRSQARAVTSIGDHAARVDFTYRVQCVTVDCLIAAGTKEKSGAILTTPILLRSATVLEKLRTGTSTRAPLAWPPVVIGLRLTSHEATNGNASAGPFSAPPVSYAVSPGLAAGLLLGLGVVLALVAGYFLAAAVRGKPVPLRLRVPAHLSPLERALALVRVAATEDTAVEARKALERLAAELRRSGHPDLTETARRLAWSQERPSPDAVEELVGDVSRSVNGE
jgi:hypothetical protein